MSTPVMPILPLHIITNEDEANAPEADSERARQLRLKRDDDIANGDVPTLNIPGADEHADEPKR